MEDIEDAREKVKTAEKEGRYIPGLEAILTAKEEELRASSGSWTNPLDYSKWGISNTQPALTFFGGQP